MADHGPDDLLDHGPDTSGTEDADRAAILARRRVFVRRAIASIGVIVGGLASTDCAPTPCLDFAPPPDAQGAEAGSDATADVPTDSRGD